ncbi:hypothetical protein [Mycobacterium botniense]|uniref:hypothetical protein n=1 Tax=Mycobacterium botniense TaxID=84962 RepID=UPI0013D2A837|nr:hypothetical protein [Mycobacterium botniense]
MRFTLNWLKPPSDAARRWPGYLFGGHVRTSTVLLVVAFLAVWWLYDSYRPSPERPPRPPATQVVPPGFIPDPNYTWVPRSRLQQPPVTVTVTTAPATTPTTTPTTTAPTTVSPTPSTSSPVPAPPPLMLPPPFGPPPPPTTAPPGPGPAP